MDIRTTDWYLEYSALGYKVLLFNRQRQGSFCEQTFKIDKPSRLGNPFESEPTADKRVTRYDAWIRGGGRRNQGVQLELHRMWKALKQYRRIGLDCHCFPKPCHGEVIAMLLLEWAHYERMPG